LPHAERFWFRSRRAIDPHNAAWGTRAASLGRQTLPLLGLMAHCRTD
jgi:hypothetical protein